MKKLALLIVLLSSLSHASFVEINEKEKKIYFHPNPQLHMTAIDLEESGGILNLSLEYIEEIVTKEKNKIKNENPEFEVELVDAESSNGFLTFDIEAIGLAENLQVKKAAFGLYLNGQLLVDSQKMEKLKKLGNELSQSVKVGASVKSQINASVVKEKYSSDPQYCDEFTAKNVRELILQFSKLEKPRSIKFTKTFDSFKQSVLDQCFEISNANVYTFSELLEAQIRPSKNTKEIIGQFSELQNQQKVYNLKPTLKIEMPN